MDELRRQAYLNLIQSLLNCPSGEENHILQANSELVDAGLVQVMQLVAENLREEGYENAADFLTNLASQLAEWLQLPSANTQLEFLKQVLQVMRESGGDRNVIYSLLRDNLNLINDDFAAILQNWARETLLNLDSQERRIYYIAHIFYFSREIVQFTLGSKACNLETAIAGYETVLTVFTRLQCAEDWATTQNYLATAYLHRIKGEKADNLENAISAFEKTLKVYTREAFREDWAGTQHNLGTAYHKRIKGEKADNLENAIVAYQAALSVYTREAFRENWAMTQHNLATAYLYRIRGEKADNLENAISACQAALSFYTREAFSQEWAMTQDNLATAYFYRIKGEKADNLENAISAFEKTLKVYTREAFREDWAMTQHNLATAYINRIKGEKADNLENAISACQAALSFYTREAFPQEWAMAQNNLATAYLYRIRGEKADNLEIAIAAYQAALSVYTLQAFPEKWAETQNNLGIAYSDRIRGEKANNLEIAIAAYQTALSVYTREAFPQEWAMTQNNLAAAYFDRIRGEKAENLEIAIATYQAALSVRTLEAFPEKWAETQNNLANVYRDRIRGEKANNLEIAIATYQAALSVYTREAFPFEWARSQNNLATAYVYRIRGEKANNLEQAISACQESLSVYTREAFPFEWARSQNNLANAYTKRIRGEKVDNLEIAITAYQVALCVYTCEAFPEDWAMTQHNLATAYLNRIKGEKADNLEMAIAAYQAALEISTHEAFPEDWAMTQNNLGIAYLNRIRDEKANILEMAISACQSALSVYTCEAFPINHAGTLFNLGVLYHDNSQLPEAYNSFNAAIKTVELMRSEIIIGSEADRQKLAEEWNALYHRMVKVCLDMENKTAALEYVERSKTRNLVELFHNTRSQPQNVQRISFQEIRSLLGEDEAILEWYITLGGFKVFIITRDSTQPDIWHSSDQDFQALEEFLQKYIDDYINQPDNWRNQLETRLEKLAKILHIDQIISRLPESCQRLILVPFLYLHLLPLHALTSRRLIQNAEETGSLLELFPGGVRYTPSCQLLQLSQRVNPTGEESSPTRLFAIQNPTEDLDFTDIEVEAIAKSFNPAEVLIREKASKTGLQEQLAALQNADIAHFSCHGFFDFSNPRKSALILAGAKVTPLNPPLARGETGEDFPLPCGEIGEDFPLVNGETGEDFPLVNSETGEVPPLSKGGLGGVSPDKSYIRSRRGETFHIAECLTLEEIFNLRLNKCSLVTLSACETGLTDIRDSTDEYIGLPSGFFYAGATSVISTLWAVNDVSTAILMIRFYEIFLSETRPPVAIALRESQLWLKEATVQDLVDWVASCKLISDERKEEMQNSIEFGQRPENKRYQSSHFWAAFCAIGQ